MTKLIVDNCESKPINSNGVTFVQATFRDEKGEVVELIFHPSCFSQFIDGVLDCVVGVLKDEKELM